MVSQELFRRFPEYHEGELSKLRAHIVSARRLLRPARELKIGDYLRLGEEKTAAAAAARAPCWSMRWKRSLRRFISTLAWTAAHRFILQHILEPELAEVRQHGGDSFR